MRRIRVERKCLRQIQLGERENPGKEFCEVERREVLHSRSGADWCHDHAGYQTNNHECRIDAEHAVLDESQQVAVVLPTRCDEEAADQKEEVDSDSTRV